MDDHELVAKLLQDHFTATAALIAVMLKNLPDDVRTRTLDAVRNGTGKVEVRTRLELYRGRRKTESPRRAKARSARVRRGPAGNSVYLWILDDAAPNVSHARHPTSQAHVHAYCRFV
jgi:hypothetical protein